MNIKNYLVLLFILFSLIHSASFASEKVDLLDAKTQNRCLDDMKQMLNDTSFDQLKLKFEMNKDSLILMDQRIKHHNDVLYEHNEKINNNSSIASDTKILISVTDKILYLFVAIVLINIFSYIYFRRLFSVEQKKLEKEFSLINQLFEPTKVQSKTINKKVKKAQKKIDLYSNDFDSLLETIENENISRFNDLVEDLVDEIRKNGGVNLNAESFQLSNGTEEDILSDTQKDPFLDGRN